MFTIITTKAVFRVQLDWSVTRTEARAWFRANYPEHGRVLKVIKS